MLEQEFFIMFFQNMSFLKKFLHYGFRILQYETRTKNDFIEFTEFEPSEELGSEIIEAPAPKDEGVSQITVLEVHESSLCGC